MGNCHPKKTNVDRGEAEVDIGFRGLTISHVTLSFSQYLYKVPKLLPRIYIFRCKEQLFSLFNIVSTALVIYM